MTTKEAFQYGFLARCIEEGLSPEETQRRLEKVAFNTPLTMAALASLALAGPPIGGYAGGRYLGHLASEGTKTDPDHYVEDLQHDEILTEYEKAIDRMRKLQELRADRVAAKKKPTGRRVGF